MRILIVRSAVLIVVLMATGLVSAQAPIMGVFSEMLSVRYDECLTKARDTLLAEGYKAEKAAGNAFWGAKGGHYATIICDGTPHPDGKIDVHVVTSSNWNGAALEYKNVTDRLMGRRSGPAQPIDPSGIPVVQATWGTSSTGQATNSKVAFDCPINGTAGRVWGTDTYSADSSVCTAAVHAGLISFASGGRVTVEVRKHEGSYTGTPRNGVTTLSAGSYSVGFVFVR